MKLGTGELLLILGIALVVFGPSKLPELGKALGETLAVAKKYMGGLTEEINEEIKKPLEESLGPLEDITAPIQEIARIPQEITKSINEVVKPTAKPAKLPVPTAVSDAAVGAVDAAVPPAEGAPLRDDVSAPVREAVNASEPTGPAEATPTAQP